MPWLCACLCVCVRVKFIFICHILLRFLLPFSPFIVAFLLLFPFVVNFSGLSDELLPFAAVAAAAAEFIQTSLNTINLRIIIILSPCSPLSPLPAMSSRVVVAICCLLLCALLVPPSLLLHLLRLSRTVQALYAYDLTCCPSPRSPPSPHSFPPALSSSFGLICQGRVYDFHLLRPPSLVICAWRRSERRGRKRLSVITT